MSGLSRDYDVFLRISIFKKTDGTFSGIALFTRIPRIQTLFNSRISPDPDPQPRPHVERRPVLLPVLRFANYL